MCGIAGIFSAKGVERSSLVAMGESLAHRGPDDTGVWFDFEAGIGLAHRRLSIVDLTPAGAQPMISAHGRFVVSYNGEVYNHFDIRRQLEAVGHVPDAGWRGHSDTETLVEAIAAWGLKATIQQAVGMFAIALWDRAERRLYLARDRFGEKPLYYGSAGGDFLFASELKALRRHPRFRPVIDKDSLGLLATRNYIPSPMSIYKNIFKLPPGCILSVNLETAHLPLSVAPVEGTTGGLSLTRYWSYPEIVRAGLKDPIEDHAEAVDALDCTLGKAVSGQSIADVPVGAFLSGGIDSSTIVALYQKHSSRPVNTYSIGFTEAGYDESGYARHVAAALGTNHNEQIVSANDAMDAIPAMAHIYDEPFADSSQIPTYLVSRFARRDVTVAITGDGGDELFGGYSRHRQLPRLWHQLRRVPKPLRSAAGGALGRIPSHLWGRMANLLPGTRPPHIGGKLQKALLVAAGAERIDDLYERFLDEWAVDGSPVLGSSRIEASWTLRSAGLMPDAARIMTCDATSYLPDDILCKVDRASMAVSLETRVPFLDHRVAMLAARMPTELNIHSGQGKQVLRSLLDRYAPRILFERPKAGFAVPIGAWLRGPLRPWAEELLDERRLKQDGWFDARAVRRRWANHLSGASDATAALWSVLMFQAWADANG